MKNKNLRQLISKNLSNYNAYFGFNKGVFGSFKYKINYQIENNTISEKERVYRVEFDIWCKSSILVDDLADELEELFNYKSYENKALCTFIMLNRYNADEKDLYRRTITYEVRSYEEA